MKLCVVFNIMRFCCDNLKILKIYRVPRILVFLQLGGLNSVLAIEQNPSIPMISKVPSIILGMDVSHGSPGQSDIPSIAAVKCFLSRVWLIYTFYIFYIIYLLQALLCLRFKQVVSSRQWPSISRYRASVRTQSPKVEMIDSLYKRVSDTEDEGIIR